MKIDENNLISQLTKRNPESIEYIIEKYNKDIYSLVYNILKDLGKDEDIEECVSEVYVQAWNKCEEYNSERGSVRTWLLILAKYKALDYRRSILKKKEYAAGDDIEVLSPELVEDWVIIEEKRKMIIDVVNTLNEMDRQIFYKRYFYYESIENIAESFGITREAVDNRLWRMRKRIKEALSKYGKEEVV